MKPCRKCCFPAYNCLNILQVVGLNEQRGKEPTAVVELQGDVTNIYKKEKQMCARHR